MARTLHVSSFRPLANNFRIEIPTQFKRLPNSSLNRGADVAIRAKLPDHYSALVKSLSARRSDMRCCLDAQARDELWSLLGTYVSVEPFHLFRYLDEQTFRYNHRGKEMNDFDRFELALSQITWKRVTYEHLTGKDREPDTALV
jgi:hypothetical protein